MKIEFKCGCFLLVWKVSQEDGYGREQAGLSCCKEHEKPYAQVQELIDNNKLELSKVTLSNK